MSIQPPQNKLFWLVFSAALFLSLILSGLILITLLNGGWVTHVRTPVISYFSLFPLFWVEEPAAALEFIATKSVILFAHQDSRTGLNIWTLEYDTISLLVYILSALFAGWLITCYRNNPLQKLIMPLAGTALIIFSVTYMTSIEHCAGATWVGFVSLYGLGVSGFDMFPYYQTVFSGTGAALTGWGLYRLRDNK